MKILRAYKTELDPTNKQRTMFNNCAGAARFVYNWALADRIERYEKGSPTNHYEQKRRFNALKGEQFPWIYEVPYTLQEQAFRNLDVAYKNFFRRVKKEKTPRFPKFKNRRTPKHFTLRGSIHIEEDRIKLPVIGWIRLKERSYLPSENDAKLLSVTISERANRWYVSAQIEEEIKDPINGNTLVVGVDFGLKTLAVLSNGETFENPHALITEQRRLARLGRELARREKGSQNWRKTKHKIQRCYAKVASIRKHVLHDISHHVTADLQPKTVVIEDLNVSGMAKNRHLSKAIYDAGFAELRRQIEYKAQWYGVEVLLADRWFASSKTCSACGCIKDDLTLADRIFKCADCGTVIDRDLNAAINLAALGELQNMQGLPVELGCNEALL